MVLFLGLSYPFSDLDFVLILFVSFGSKPIDSTSLNFTFVFDLSKTVTVMFEPEDPNFCPFVNLVPMGTNW